MTPFFDDLFGPMNLESSWFAPSVDVQEDEKEFLLTVDLPGVERENMHVECSNGVLDIRAERKEREGGKRSGRRFHGSFQKTMSLPAGVDAEQIRADYRDGVLSIHIPRPQETRSGARRIEIAGDDKSLRSSPRQEQQPH